MFKYKASVLAFGVFKFTFQIHIKWSDNVLLLKSILQYIAIWVCLIGMFGEWFDSQMI